MNLPAVFFRSLPDDTAPNLEPVHDPDDRCRMEVNAAGELLDTETG
jgi:hypothetical protein